jgi:hypothetical protein
VDFLDAEVEHFDADCEGEEGVRSEDGKVEVVVEEEEMLTILSRNHMSHIMRNSTEHKTSYGA